MQCFIVTDSKSSGNGQSLYVFSNVKTDPNYSDILRNTYDYVIPAYHMNKEHWNTIIIDKKVDEDLVKELIEQSYQLTK